MSKGRLKGVYARPLAKKVGQQIPLTRDQLKRAGDIILEHIKKEIKKDIAKSAGLRPQGEPVPLPNTSKFPDSFKVRVKGNIIEITSDWPTAKAHTTDPTSPNFLGNTAPKGSAPIPMVWLTRPKVPFARIVRRNGEVVVRTTPDPSKGQAVWIHPGFRKYTFLERGIRKGREAAVRMLASEIIQDLLQQNDLF